MMGRHLLLLAVLVPAVLGAQGGRCIPVRSDGDLPFRSGETLRYALSYNWHAVATDVASGALTLDSTLFAGTPAYHATMSARTAKFFDVFFKVREGFQSWFTADGLQPRKFIRDTHEGSYYAYNLYRYDTDARVIHADLETKSRGKYQLDLPYGDCTYDLPALLYFTRTMDAAQLQPGTNYHITFAIDDDVYVLTLTFKGREDKYVKGLGRVGSMKFGCSVVAGEMFDGSEDALLWISDDENRIPVYFMAPLKVGAVSGRLASWSGLKHPFSSLKNPKR
ncbi:MAG: DUF3108 domain-containing protein [Bacteroidales bacterium]|nr:DUF3108 domain-containing protein [Bacteroidales bacterium]MBR1706495.1 DUF3108 domain-containing protein [Bacteroidales bacterium]